jgi:CubicO group peptidase (beta-lactamase class C family)
MLRRRALLTAALAALPLRTLAEDHSLAALIRRHRVPAAGLVVLRDGAIAERVAIGATAETLFQAASISKVVTGIAVLRLVQRGKLALDQPVTIVPNPFDQPVTPRLLLSHRAGTGVSGFPGYKAGTPLPSLRQILDGIPPANTPAVRVTQMPGQGYRYSGGGTMVLQQLVENVMGASFATVATREVLEPLGLARSNFVQPLPDQESDVATGHDLLGKPVGGRFHVYPELAAAGLWSTANDLARLALAVTADRPLLELMARPVGNGPASLGLFVRARPGRPPLLYHYGVNAGFRAVLAFASDASFGVALTVNGAGGQSVIPAFCGPLFQSNGQGDFPSIG